LPCNEDEYRAPVRRHVNGPQWKPEPEGSKKVEQKLVDRDGKNSTKNWNFFGLALTPKF